MRKKLFVFGAVFGETIGLLSSGVVMAFAQQVCPPGYENLCKMDVSQNTNFVGNFIQILIVLAVVLSVIYLVWSGIRWIMSGGDKGKVEAARSGVIASIVGLIISLLAYFIISIVVYIITGKSDLQLSLPKLV